MTTQEIVEATTLQQCILQQCIGAAICSAQLEQRINPSRELSLVITKLQEAEHWLGATVNTTNKV